MGWNIILSSARVSFTAFVVQNFPMRHVYLLEDFNYENYTDFDYANYTKRQWHIMQSVTHKVSWNEILFGVLQQSFRVFAVKHFHMRHVLLPWRLSLCKLCRWLYTKNTGFIVNDLEPWLSIIFMRLQDNRMKGNTGKNHFSVSSNFRDTIKIDSN